MKKGAKLFDLEGKRALVTGGYRGLGLAIARGLAEAGATVALNGRSKDSVESSVSQFRSEGFVAHPAVFDITDGIAVVEAVERLEEEMGLVDVLINNAGIQRRSLLAEMSLADFRLVIETNLTSAFSVGQAVAKGMLERRSGKIVNICSVMSYLARPTTGNYAAAKGGLQMLTKAMAGEWAASNIQVNGIAPGYFETDLTRSLKEDPKFNSWICDRVPANRWGDPAELQGLAVFLASEASSYVNGQVIAVDGGLMGVV